MDGYIDAWHSLEASIFRKRKKDRKPGRLL